MNLLNKYKKEIFNNVLFGIAETAFFKVYIS